MRDRLLLAATDVRRALEHPEVTFEGFPSGYCQGASKMLAKYLVEVVGITPVEAIANGVRYLFRLGHPDWPIEQSHFWLEQSRFIIDITADQFEDCAESVIVTADRSWHDQLCGQNRLNQEVAVGLNDFLLERYSRMLKFIGGGGQRT